MQLQSLFCGLQIVTVNCARITHANQVSTNGVVHVIDRVIGAAESTIKEAINTQDELSSLSVCIKTYSL